MLFSRPVPAALRAIAFLTCLAPAAALAQSAAAPQLPRVYLNTSTVAPSGRTIAVNAGGNLQSAIDSAVPGDVIVLQAGATFTGSFRLPNKSGSGWITIRTSATDSQLPPAGTRITPSSASLLPKIVTRDSGPAMSAAPGAHHYRFIGVEFGIASGVAQNYNIIQLGEDRDSSLSQLPHNIIFDRVYVHGNTTGNARRGIMMNSASTAVIDSYISEIHEVGSDSQAIASWNGPGPFKIVNNYLEAAGENVMFGGSDPTIVNLVPSDIEVRRNKMSKPLKWRQGHPTYAGTAWTVKNIFELKNAQRVLIEGNIFEHNWPHAQNGYSILFTVRNQDGTAPWSVVQDVTFSRNIVRHVSSGVNILGHDNLQSAQQTKRIRIVDNLFTDVSGANWGGSGRLIQLLDGPADISIEHNTVFQSAELVVASGTATTHFDFRDNLVNAGYGFGGDGTYGNSMLTLSTYFPSCLVTRNAMVAGSSSQYPTGNFFPGTFNDVGFVSLSGGDYRLSSTSPYKNGGTDGKDIGADIAAINAALTGSEAPPPSGGGGTVGTIDSTAPSVTVTQPGTGASLTGLVTVAAAASDNIGVAGVRFMVDGAQIGAEIVAAPYSLSWNTAAVSDGTHQVTAIARDFAGNTSTSAAAAVSVANGGGAGGGTGGGVTGGQSVVWQHVRNITASASSVQKTAGCDGCQDAGACSVQTITSGTGYLEFIVPDTTTQRVIGLSNGDSDHSERDIDFAVKFWPGGTADVRVNGSYQNRSEVRFAAGDKLRVQVVTSNTIDFLKNGVAFFRLRKQVRYPILVDLALASMNGRLSNVVISGAAGAPEPAPAPAPIPGTPSTLTWMGKMNLDLVGTALTKIAGCDGCQDAGAISAQSIALGGTGYVEFTTPDAIGQRVIGLSVGNTDTTEADIDFGLKLWHGGVADVRENGVYVNAEMPHLPGDRFRIAVANGVVTYSKNGVVFYTSRKTASGALLVDTAYTSFGGQLSDIVLVGGN